MITVSWAVMAHPKRTEFVPELLDWLGQPDMAVVWDRCNDRWDTGRRSMLAYDPDCSHHAVIQDDVLPCRDLVAAIPQLLERVTDGCPLCGYVGSVRPSADLVEQACLAANAKGASFIRMQTLNWGPLIVVPTNVIDEMIAFCDTLTDIPNYDRRLSRYWELVRQVPVWYAWPALVDHRDGPSLIPGRMGTHHNSSSSDRRGSRVARRFLGMEESALDRDWTDVCVDAALAYSRYSGPTVSFRHTRAGKILTIPVDHPRVAKLEANHLWERVA